MKTVLLFSFFLFTSFWVDGQTPDTALARVEIDSLIKTSISHRNKIDFLTSKEQSVLANKLAMEFFGEKSIEYGNTCFNLGDHLRYTGNMKNL